MKKEVADAFPFRVVENADLVWRSEGLKSSEDPSCECHPHFDVTEDVEATVAVIVLDLLFAVSSMMSDNKVSRNVYTLNYASVFLSQAVTPPL
jgi:hypothetical protein